MAFKHEKELRQAEGSLQDMERYLEQREKWTKMDRVVSPLCPSSKASSTRAHLQSSSLDVQIAEKQRQREEDIKVNALKLKRFKERRRKRRSSPSSLLPCPLPPLSEADQLCLFSHLRRRSIPCLRPRSPPLLDDPGVSSSHDPSSSFNLNVLLLCFASLAVLFLY